MESAPVAGFAAALQSTITYAWKSRADISIQFHQHLAGVAAAEEREKRLRLVLDAVLNGLFPLDAAVLHPLRHLGDELLAHVDEVEHDETLHLDPLADDIGHVARAGRWFLIIVHRDHAALDEA